MHYAAIVDGKDEVEVEIHEITPGRYRIAMNERELEVDVQPTADGSVSCILNNQAYGVEFDPHPKGGESLLVNGSVVQVEVLDLRRMRLRKVTEETGRPAGPATITSPMPGKIVAVLVEEGQQVKEGEGVVVVEAMKMENELKAPRDGVVTKLSAKEGEAVDSGKTLCSIE